MRSIMRELYPISLSYQQLTTLCSGRLCWGRGDANLSAAAQGSSGTHRKARGGMAALQPLVPKAAGKKSSMPVLALAALALVVGAFAVLGMGQVGGLATTDHSSHKKHHKHEKFDQENHPAGWVDHRKEDGNALNDAAKVARSARVVAEHPANWVDHHHPAAAAVVNAVASAPALVMAPAPAPVMA